MVLWFVKFPIRIFVRPTWPLADVRVRVTYTAFTHPVIKPCTQTLISTLHPFSIP